MHRQVLSLFYNAHERRMAAGLLVCLILFVSCGRTTEAPVRATSTRPILSVGSAKTHGQDMPDTDQLANDRQPADKASALPRLRSKGTTYDFGQMDPYAIGEHRFIIYNDGEAPLILQNRRSTCKCTVSDVPAEPILPGQSAEVAVKWQTSTNNRRFHESASVETNDPDTPELRLTVTGRVLVHVGADPPELTLPAIKPDEQSSVTTIVSSQVWQAFHLSDLQSSLDGIQWQIEPADSTDLERLNALSGIRLTARLPQSLAQGDFVHWVRFRVVPELDRDGSPMSSVPSVDDEQLTFELPLRGKVLRRLSVYGDGIDATGTVRLGAIPATKEYRHRLWLKVRDDDRQLHLKNSIANPDFLRAEIKPHVSRGTELGLYQLEIVVPHDATVGRHQGPHAGTLTLAFDHPRIPELRLHVDFAVVSPISVD